MKIQDKRDQAAEKLYLTVENLKTLKSDQFDYSLYVSEYDKKENCGTVCCVAGWYPKWFPKANLYWKNKDLSGTTDLYDIHKELSNYHKLKTKLIQTLFYGQNLIYKKDILISNSIKSDLSEVIELFETIADNIVIGNLDTYLI